MMTTIVQGWFLNDADSCYTVTISKEPKRYGSWQSERVAVLNASPSNDPAIGIMALELGIKWQLQFESCSIPSPNHVPTGPSYTLLGAARTPAFHNCPHDEEFDRLRQPCGIPEAHRYTIQRPR